MCDVLRDLALDGYTYIYIYIYYATDTYDQEEERMVDGAA